MDMVHLAGRKVVLLAIYVRARRRQLKRKRSKWATQAPLSTSPNRERAERVGEDTGRRRGVKLRKAGVSPTPPNPRPNRNRVVRGRLEKVPHQTPATPSIPMTGRSWVDGCRPPGSYRTPQQAYQGRRGNGQHVRERHVWESYAKTC